MFGNAIAIILIGVGLFLLVLGFILGGLSLMKIIPEPVVAVGSASTAITALSATLFQRARIWRRRTRLGWSQKAESELATSLTPHLFGDYSPYIIEAAEQLGAAKDMTAIPALMQALENCADAQRPGWREVAEVLVQTLAQIGDARALPLLYKLENVRGIGFIPAIRTAIAGLEPQTSLLRPGSADDTLAPVTLLRPMKHRMNEQEKELLLRATESGDREV